MFVGNALLSSAQPSITEIHHRYTGASWEDILIPFLFLSTRLSEVWQKDVFLGEWPSLLQDVRQPGSFFAEGAYILSAEGQGMGGGIYTRAHTHTGTHCFCMCNSWCFSVTVFHLCLQTAVFVILYMYSRKFCFRLRNSEFWVFYSPHTVFFPSA